jgi:archaellum component FlaC
MKKYGMILSAVCILAVGCTDYKSQVERLNEEKKAMAYQSAYKDSSIDAFMATINEIEANLQEIEVKQNIIKKNTKDGELKESSKERINASIAAINQLMEENKSKIAQLNKQIKSSKYKVAQLDKMIGNLNEQLATKDSELEQLNQRLIALNTEVETLTVTVDTLRSEGAAKTSVIEAQTAELHKAYYTTGSKKELETKQVITREGGFLGLGKEEVLKSDLNSSAFTPVDITQVAKIEVDGKDAKIVTPHPTDSYKLERDEKEEVKEIVITDPEKFWSASKYLVVMVDKK